jgi:Nucleotide modification associated domain 3
VLGGTHSRPIGAQRFAGSRFPPGEAASGSARSRRSPAAGVGFGWSQRNLRSVLRLVRRPQHSNYKPASLYINTALAGRVTHSPSFPMRSSEFVSLESARVVRTACWASTARWLSSRKCGEEKALASGPQAAVFIRSPERSSTSWKSIRTPRLFRETPSEARGAYLARFSYAVDSLQVMRGRWQSMKIIISRKGFDGSAGGGSSPVIDRDRIASLPIPDIRGLDQPYYRELTLLGANALVLLRSLGYTTFNDLTVAHLDPDLDWSTRPRAGGKSEWRGMFGQSQRPATHLDRQGVGPGDVFLFFGRFRHAAEFGGKYRFIDAESRHFHALWGYLQIGQVISDAASADPPKWAQGHPHFSPVYLNRRPNNVYVARRTLSEPFDESLPGWGLFAWNEKLRLTRDGSSHMTKWRLPSALHPDAGIDLTSIPRSCWDPYSTGNVDVTVPGRWQESVSTNASIDTLEWVASLLECRRTAV